MAALDNLDLTRPYISLVLAKYTASRGISDIVDDLVAEIKAELKLEDDDSPRSLAAEDGDAADSGVRRAFVHYRESRPPSWLVPDSTSDINDELNHLLVVLRKGKYLGVYGSDPAVKAILSRRLKMVGGEGAFAHLKPIKRKVLTDAFVHGPARTLWLSGIHRRTAVKADSKILSGVELQSALNPLDDQSYHFTAVRSEAKLGGDPKPIGLSQRRSNVWIGLTKTWLEFRDQSKAILAAVQAAEENPSDRVAAIPVLAIPVTNGEDVSGAFDVALIPPELLADDPSADSARLEELEKWAYRARFEITGNEKANVSVRGFLDDGLLGDFDIDVTIVGHGRISVTVDGTIAAGVDEDQFNAMKAVLNKPRWLKVRYESGQTLSDGSLYSQRFRDLPFARWRFEDLGESASPRRTNPKREKPTPNDNPQRFLIDDIGNQDSLFCWVAKNWFGLPGFGSPTGWLLCDDGAGEIADFIHLDEVPDDGGMPMLSLIHVKGSKSDKANRSVSVSDHEIVCGQAVKNLRSLDQINLADQLEQGAGNSVARATWQNGNHVGERTGAIAAIRGLGSNYRRRVIVFQPRVTESAHAIAQRDIDSGSQSARANRLRQLNTLLLGAEADCRDLGADFWVLSSKI